MTQRNLKHKAPSVRALQRLTHSLAYDLPPMRGLGFTEPLYYIDEDDQTHCLDVVISSRTAQ